MCNFTFIATLIWTIHTCCESSKKLFEVHKVYSPFSFHFFHFSFRIIYRKMFCTVCVCAFIVFCCAKGEWKRAKNQYKIYDRFWLHIQFFSMCLSFAGFFFSFRIFDKFCVRINSSANKMVVLWSSVGLLLVSWFVCNNFDTDT